MIGLLNSLFNLISIMIGFFENYKSNKKSELEIEQYNKIKAYEKLQKAIKARMATRKSVATDDFMSDDGYKRKKIN